MMRSRLVGVLSALLLASLAAIWIQGHQEPGEGPAASSSRMVAVEMPPESPPDVALVAMSSGVWAVVQRGVIVNGSWRGEPGLRQAVPGTVDWPAVAILRRDQPAGIRIPGVALPRTLTVSAYKGRLMSDGTPGGPPVLELECGLSMFLDLSSECVLDEGEHGWVLGLPALVVADRLWVAVNITWFDPALEVDGAVVWATWLFAISTSDAG